MKCLKCEKEFEQKRNTAKFCSVSCRVGWHRMFGKKNLVTTIQMQVLYNEMMEAVAEIKRGGVLKPINETWQGNQQYAQTGNLVKKQASGVVRTYAWYLQAKIDCQTSEDWLELSGQIDQDPSLTQKQKDSLLKPR
jgi:hypothetical protein